MDIKIVGIFKDHKTIYRFGIKSDKLYLSHTIFMKEASDWFLVDAKSKGSISSKLQKIIDKYLNLIERDIKLRELLGEEH